MNAIKDKLLQGKISSFFFLLVMFFLPISREIFVIALWPWIFFLLLESLLTGWSRWLSIKRVTPIVFILPVMFILQIISLLWTSNHVEGWNHIGRSALMIIFPLLLGFDKTLSNNPVRLKKILKVYVFGTLFSLLFLLLYSLIFSLSFTGGQIVYNPLISSWEHKFFYNHFSVLIHPTYYGLMVLMAAAICLNEIVRNNIYSRSQLWPVIMSVGFLSSVLLISSRTVIIASIFLILWFLLIKIQNRIFRIFSVASIFIILLFVASLHPRFKEIRDVLGTKDRIEFNQLIENADRGKTWDASFRLIQEHPVLGLGVGDVKDSLTNFYHKESYFDESQNYLNCHNQFMETWLGVGIIGFLLLIIMLILPFMSSRPLELPLYGSFFLIILIGFMFESLLNRLWGVAFISLFYILLSRGENYSSKTSDIDHPFDDK